MHFLNNYKLQLEMFYVALKFYRTNGFRRKLLFVKFVGSSERIASRHDKYASCRIAEPRRLFSFSFPRSVSRKRHTQEYVRGTNFHRSPVVPVRPLLRRTNFSFCLPAVVLPLSDDGSLGEFKVNLGHETVLWRVRGVSRQRPRATCHREPPGSAGLTLISLLR